MATLFYDYGLFEKGLSGKQHFVTLIQDLMCVFEFICVCSARRLLENIQQLPDTCVDDGRVSLYGASNLSAVEITVVGAAVCGVGDTEVIYDIGNLDSSGNFVPTVLSAYSQIIAVVAGPASFFQLAVASNQIEKTFSVIRSAIMVQVMDAGRNVRQYYI